MQLMLENVKVLWGWERRVGEEAQKIKFNLWAAGGRGVLQILGVALNSEASQV